MVVKYSGIGITDARGRIGGTILSGNQVGRMASNYRKPQIRRSATQQQQRNAFQRIIARWPILSEAQREGWNTAAATGDWDRTNIIGVTWRPSGYQLFTTLNLSLKPAELALTTAPTKPTLSPPLLTSATITDAGTISITFSSGSIGGSEYMILDATPSISPGIFEPRHSKFKFITIVDSASFSSSFSIATPYIALFGDPVASCSIFIKAELLDGNSGDRATAGQVKTIVS